MIRRCFGHLLTGLLAMWLAASLAFVLAQAAPGGPAVALAGEHGAAGHLEEVTRAYGLDRPIMERYAAFVGRLAVLDLGFSYRSQAPVADLILERAPLTLSLMLPALALSILIGVPLGVWLSRGAAPFVASALAGLAAAPSYVVAQGLIAIFALGLGWFPVQGVSDARATMEGPLAFLAVAHRLVLPVAALALVQAVFIAQLVRARVADELTAPYVLTARMKGLSFSETASGHALPNAAAAVVALMGWRFGALASGAVVIETVFALPGVGRLAVVAALSRDYPVVIGVTLATASFVVIANVIADVVADRFDPRRVETAP